MVNSFTTEFFINILIHVFIIFTFLTIFFFLYISKIQKKIMEKEIKTLINDKITYILTYFDKMLGKYNKQIDLASVRRIKNEICKYDPNLDKKTKKNNTMLLINNIIFLTGFALLIGIIISYNFICDRKVNLTKIIFINIVAFMFIGIVEFIIFSNIIIKYIPITSDTLSTTIINEIAKNITLVNTP